MAARKPSSNAKVVKSQGLKDIRITLRQSLTLGEVREIERISRDEDAADITASEAIDNKMPLLTMMIESWDAKSRDGAELDPSNADDWDHIELPHLMEIGRLVGEQLEHIMRLSETESKN